MADDDGKVVVVPRPESVTAPVDRAMLARLAGVVDEATQAFEAYDYARAVERTESFFWSFCDDYLELVKTRAYGDAGQPGPASAQSALALALSAQLRLLAPVLPFVTEEVWSWWKVGSIHTAPWPSPGELGEWRADGPGEDRPGSDGIGLALEVASDVLGQVRKAKTEAKRSMRWPVTTLTVADTAGRIAALRSVEEDLRDAGGVVNLVTAEGDPAVVVRLADGE
jgi:valyl-tRNA synthetase